MLSESVTPLSYEIRHFSPESTTLKTTGTISVQDWVCHEGRRKKRKRGLQGSPSQDLEVHNGNWGRRSPHPSLSIYVMVTREGEAFPIV